MALEHLYVTLEFLERGVTLVDRSTRASTHVTDHGDRTPNSVRCSEAYGDPFRRRIVRSSNGLQALNSPVEDSTCSTDIGDRCSQPGLRNGLFGGLVTQAEREHPATEPLLVLLDSSFGSTHRWRGVHLSPIPNAR